MRLSWPLHKLEDLTEPTRPITYGVVKPGPEDPDNGVKFIRGGDIFEGRLAIDSLRTITPEVSNSYSRTLLSGGELVVSLVGNPGHVAVVPKSLAGANLARQAGLVALREEIDADFIKFFLMSPQGRAELFAQMTGSVQVVINLHNLRTVRVPLPPLPIQRRIAGILSAYDELIENSQRRIKILESMARSLYREWFVHFRFPGHESVPRVPSPLGEIPQGWEVRRIDEALRFDSGRTIKKEERGNGNIPVYGANGIIGGTANAAMAGRSIIMGKIGSCGALHRSHVPCWVTNNAFLVQLAAIQSWELAWQALLQIDFQQYVGGAANPYMPISAFAQHEVLVPTASVQAEFQMRAAALQSLVETLSERMDNLRRTRDLLLPRLISGELDVEALAA